MWNCGLGGPIQAASLCRLHSLHVMAVSQNALRGTVPECVADLSLEWLWLDENRIHGPISEYAPLGQYLKNVDSLNLAQNRWAPLLRTEKAALEAAAEPLGVTAAEPGWAGHDWDFGYSYKWVESIGPETGGLTAERERSYRYWSAGVPFEGILVALPFEFPRKDDVDSAVAVGRDGDLATGSSDNIKWVRNAYTARGGRQESDSVVFEVGSGEYEFESWLA